VSRDGSARFLRWEPRSCISASPMRSALSEPPFLPLARVDPTELRSSNSGFLDLVTKSWASRVGPISSGEATPDPATVLWCSVWAIIEQNPPEPSSRENRRPALTREESSRGAYRRRPAAGRAD
jgi:hypothetical protein